MVVDDENAMRHGTHGALRTVRRPIPGATRYRDARERTPLPDERPANRPSSVRAFADGDNPRSSWKKAARVLMDAADDLSPARRAVGTRWMGEYGVIDRRGSIMTFTLSYTAVPDEGRHKPAASVREPFDSPEAALKRAREILERQQGFMPRIADETDTVILETRDIVQALGLEISTA
jgi:hypothetical protein